MKKNRIALIGCGRIGFLLENDPLRNKPCTHLGGAGSAGLKITHACDINRERLAEFGQAASIHEKNLHDDYRNLLDEVRPGMVIISTWTDTHHVIGMHASACGAKVIVLEKPIAHDLKKAGELINSCRKNRVSLIINHERRYDGRYRKVRSLIHEGKIGEIKTVHASILTGGHSAGSRIEMGGGPLLHDGTHLIDIIRFLFGEIKSVTGEFQRTGRTRGFEDRAVAWLKTEDDTDIFLEAGGGRKYFVFELEISGTEGKIIIGNGYEKLFMRRTSRYYLGFMDLEERPFPKYDRTGCFRRMYAEAGKILNGRSSEVESSGLDGYRALEAIHGIYLSSHLKGKKIDLPVDIGLIDIKKIFNL